MNQNAMHEFGLNYISALKYSPFSASCYNSGTKRPLLTYISISFDWQKALSLLTAVAKSSK